MILRSRELRSSDRVVEVQCCPACQSQTFEYYVRFPLLLLFSANHKPSAHEALHARFSSRRIVKILR